MRAQHRIALIALWSTFSGALAAQQAPAPAQPPAPQVASRRRRCPGRAWRRTRGPPPTPRAGAAFDPTGYWVSVVTEDWRWRMVTPAKGDYASVPLSAEGRRVADTWDLAKDKADGNECRAFGAAGLLRLPLRVRFTWQDDNTLKLETDSGQQVRLLHFGPAPAQKANRAGRATRRPSGSSRRNRPVSASAVEAVADSPAAT